ncbi:L,D-transpeptidase [Comamonas koreensis]|uniref:L,D-transpeptidase n=1 Tax=Comamonas koreensis TaxID=160825 RepID=A0AAW4Y0J2_9BURK|nr:L,D-transpeptidase [Comamonas koreensis]MCD2166446.1 L,D-transpeptidase [Comamonas koreensis]
MKPDTAGLAMTALAGTISALAICCSQFNFQLSRRTMLVQVLSSIEMPARIHVSVERQSLHLALANGVERHYDVSTAANGTGCETGSYCTPTGVHRIRLKIGEGCPKGAVFRRRRSTGEIFDPELAERFPDRDWILTRILWLEGLQYGINRASSVDTLRRFIYIHGTADEHLIGRPVSHGCIRMRNDEIVDLFSLIPTGIAVHIE